MKAIELAVGAKATSVRINVEPFTEQPENRSFSQQLRVVLGEGGLRDGRKQYQPDVFEMSFAGVVQNSSRPVHRNRAT